MFQLEWLNEANAPRVMQIQRDDVPVCFAEDIAYTIKLATYGDENHLRGHCYAVKHGEQYVRILLIGEAIPDSADPPELKGKDYFRIIGFVIDKGYRRQGIGSRALQAAINEIYREYGPLPILLECHKDNKAALDFYTKMGFRNTGILHEQDYYFIL